MRKTEMKFSPLEQRLLRELTIARIQKSMQSLSEKIDGAIQLLNNSYHKEAKK